MRMYQKICLILFSLLLLGGNAIAQDKAVRILAIGNSFSEDAIEQHLFELAEAEGILTIIGNMYIPGCSLERHVSNARENAAAYAYRKVGLDGKKVETLNMSLEKVLADEEWDYVSLQQASPLSGIYNTYTAHLPELIAYFKTRLPKHTKLILHQTWAYAGTSNHDGFRNYQKNQLTMYHAITAAVKRAAKDNKIDIIVPSGTAIQNARTSYIGDHLDRDGYHLGIPVGRYTAACTWFECIFRRKVVGNRYRPHEMSDREVRVAQTAAHLAVKHPGKVTNLKKYGL